MTFYLKPKKQSMRNLVIRPFVYSALAGVLLFSACSSSETKENSSTDNTATNNTATETATENNAAGNATTASASSADLETGKRLYSTNCAVCHKLNNEVLIGPGLAGINQRHKEEWLVSWIKNSQKVIESGDKYAVELFNKYNKVPMPAYENFSDDEIKSILAYIEQNQEK
jgi:mono/diheme cytochrome c family protein